MATKLAVTGPEGTREILLDPRGTILGRGANCEVVLDDETVSRLHARIYQDPFGRWIVEDLGSHNGVILAGKRVKAQAVLPGQKITISHFSLFIREDSATNTTTDATLPAMFSVVDKGPQEDLVVHSGDRTAQLSPVLMQGLNELTAHLLTLESPSELYAQACSRLADMLDALVVFVRVPLDTEQLGQSPDILSCAFGANSYDQASVDISGLHLSMQILQSVRSKEAPVMASSRQDAGKAMMLTVVDEYRPHLVFAARVNDLGEAVDALYVDVQQDKSPDNMLDFIEAVSRQINFVQKNLFLAELQKQQEELRKANTLLREKDRIKDEYVSRVTHDIKGHLAAIQSCLYVVANGASEIMDEKVANFLDRAQYRTGQLTTFVRELLELTRMRLSGKLKMEPFALPDSITRVLDAVASKAEEKSITVKSKIDPGVGEIVGNQFSITEVLSNLMFNAVKYTPDNGTVEIVAATKDGSVRIDVIDTGIGIPADELDSVFDEFFRASNATKGEIEGTGLGLSIVKQIVESHGGQASVKSTSGQGTTFTVVFPINCSVYGR